MHTFSQDFSAVVDCVDNMNTTPLMHASAFGLVDLVDLVFESDKDLSAEAINDALREAAAGPLKGVLAAMDAPLVSSDLVGHPASSIADLGVTQTMGPRLGKVLSWYDNEWGFSNRMIDLTRRMGTLGKA